LQPLLAHDAALLSPVVAPTASSSLNPSSDGACGAEFPAIYPTHVGARRKTSNERKHVRLQAAICEAGARIDHQAVKIVGQDMTPAIQHIRLFHTWCIHDRTGSDVHQFYWNSLSI